MTVMCPPQHGQGGQVSGGSAASTGSDWNGTASNALARAMLIRRLPLASSP